MPVSDLVTATLSAQLAGNVEKHKQLLRQIATPDDRRGYAALLNAAFFEAVDQRFPENTTREEVIGFVADVRSRTEGAREALDPRAAEQVLGAAIGHADLDGLDGEQIRHNQRFLLMAMAVDAGLEGSLLDEFMAKARKSADSMLGG